MHLRIKPVDVFFLLFPTCVLFLLAGCFGAGVRPPGTDTDGGSLTGIAGTIARIAVLISGLATVALVACGVAFFFVPNKLAVGKFACAAFAALLSAGILYWLAEHWALAVGCSAGVLLLGLFCYGYLHRKDIEKRTGIDLNKDGLVG